MKSTEMSAGKRGDDAEEHGALVFRHAGGGLVEQQHLRPRRERQRDLEQPLLAIGQGACRARRDLGEAQLAEDREGFVDGTPVRGEAAPELSRDAIAFADRQRHGLDRRQIREQRVDLEGARQPVPDARSCWRMRNVLAAQQNAAGIRLAAAR